MTIWQENCKHIQEHFKNDHLSDFTRWSTINATMFVGNAPYIYHEFRDIPEYYPYIVEPRVGNPELFDGWTSGNLIHQAYHLKQWQIKTKQKLSRLNTIFEIGAGYGTMALLCHRLGFRGTYHILDLPELCQLQKHYLKETGVDNTEWSIPNSCDLLIACFSLSEMPLSERILIESKEYLFVSMYDFDGVNNLLYFEKVASQKRELDWILYSHPYLENTFYQIGIEK